MIPVPAEMKHAVDNGPHEFLGSRSLIAAGLAQNLTHTYEDLTVQVYFGGLGAIVKRDDIGGACMPEEPFVKLGDPSATDEVDGQAVTIQAQMVQEAANDGTEAGEGNPRTTLGLGQVKFTRFIGLHDGLHRPE